MIVLKLTAAFVIACIGFVIAEKYNAAGAMIVLATITSVIATILSLIDYFFI